MKDGDIRKEIWRKKINIVRILNKYDEESKELWNRLGLYEDWRSGDEELIANRMWKAKS